MAPNTRPAISFPLIAALLLAGAAIVVLAAEPLLSIPLRIQRNYNEGWLALLAERAVTGGALYPPDGSFIANNYPPLPFYLVGLLGHLTGDDVIAGRLLALAGFLATAACIFAAVRTMTGGRRWASTATAIFLLYGVTLFQGYLAMADPQWLAHAFASLALVLLLRHPDGRPPAGAIVAACVLMLVSGLIKHNLLALPVAVTAWLMWHHRRGMIPWLGTAALGGGAILAALYAAYGEPVFTGVLGHVRAARLSNILWVPWELRSLLPLAALGLLALLRWRSPRTRLVLIFAIIAGVWGLVQRLGDGVTYNAQFEMVIALCIAAGIGLAEMAARARWRPMTAVAAGAAAIALSLPLLFLTARMVSEAPGNIAGLDGKARQWEALIAETSLRVGPAACERLAVCYWAGKGFELDFFNYGQRLLTGAAAIGGFDALMRAHTLKQIIVPATWIDGTGRQVVPPGAVRIMLDNYEPRATAVDGQLTLLPKERGATP